MKRKRSLTAFLLALVAVFATFSAVIFTACAPEEEKTQYTVTWNVGENATVSAEGYGELPKTVDEGTVITFTVSPATGYEATVKGAENKDGKYSLTVNKNSTVTVTTEKVVTNMIVAGPTKLVYYAGESVDKNDLVVTVTYADNTVAVITDYTISPATFSAGDTKFTVSYKNQKKEIALEKPVEAKEYKATEITLEMKDGLPYYVVKGTYSVYTDEEIKGLHMDFQSNGNYPGGKWEWLDQAANTTITAAEGKFEIRVNISFMSIGQLYMPHLGFSAEAGENKRPDLLVADAEGELVYEGKRYVISIDEDSWNLMTSVKVFDANSAE